MDFQPAQPDIPTVPIKSPNYINKTLLLSLATLLIGFILGLIAWPLLPFGQTKVIEISNQKLPVSLSLLTNPIVYEWRGSVKGKLTGKDKHTFTLTDEQGSSITITNLTATGETFKTLFFNKDNKDRTQLFLEDIPIGSVLRGDFFIFKNGPNIPVGSVFFKEIIK